jgi:hypothetical protein
MQSARILKFTDTHLFSDPQGTLRGTRTLPSLRACLEHARRRYLPDDGSIATEVVWLEGYVG